MRSCSVNPSWQVTKLMLWTDGGHRAGRRGRGRRCRRAASSAPAPCTGPPGRSGGRRRGSGRSTAARGGRGTASRAGSSAASHGSAIRWTSRRTGSARIAVSSGSSAPPKDPSGLRASTEARSNRKPSTRISVTQCRRLSRMSGADGQRVAGECVAAAGVVAVRAAGVVRGEVVGCVVDPPEAVGRPRVVSSAGRVDDVKDDRDPRLVQGLDHRLELPGGSVGLAA